MKIFLLYGLGGAGKTQLALEFKKRFKKKFTRIFYIYANTVEYIQGSYWDIATTMESKVVQNWQIGLHLLEATEENWLLIINNADDPGLSLDTYIPSCDHGNIIITSRNPELQSLADDSLELQDMTSDEGTQLLIKHAFDRRKQVIELEEKEKAAEIAKELYYFPLALVQAGAYINRQKCLNDYLDRLHNQRKELLEKNITQSRDKYHLSVYATWNLSWNKLSDRSKKLLEIFSHLHFERIPRALFERAANNFHNNHYPSSWQVGVTKEGKDIMDILLLSNSQWSNIIFDDIISEILSYSLVYIHNDAALYTLHPLVHQWLIDSL
ncbi:P-loop containing nucleoside triphosphate hydrolase protein, partial [Lentinula raphanica]